MNIIIPEDYFEGHSCLAYQIPWQTPESIFKEAQNITSDDVALEIGAGGSTLFLARRCKRVLSIETNEEWRKKVWDACCENNLLNVQSHLLTTEELICLQIRAVATQPITILSIDTQGGFNRSRFLQEFLLNAGSKNLKMIILDNYSHPELFPDHFDKNIFQGDPEWEMFDYNHDRWAGSGTRIYLKINKQ